MVNEFLPGWRPGVALLATLATMPDAHDDDYDQFHRLRGLGVGSSSGVPQLFIQVSISSQGTALRVRLNSARRRASSASTSGAQGPVPAIRMDSRAGGSTSSAAARSASSSETLNPRAAARASSKSAILASTSRLRTLTFILES